jgi:hypothetical protein
MRLDDTRFARTESENHIEKLGSGERKPALRFVNSRFDEKPNVITFLLARISRET